MHDTYNSPIAGRYASKEMSDIFSDNNRYSTWRKLWLFLAEAQKELGVEITDAQIEEMRQHLCDIDFDRAAEIEKTTHHDVVAHIRAYAEQCPTAAPIIHLGATSCYVTDNTDVILMRSAMFELERKLRMLLRKMCYMAEIFSADPTLGYTHLQPAQPTTIGKRVAMWIQDFTMDYQNLVQQSTHLKPLGCRGATGTADSFLKLFRGHSDMVTEMENIILRKMGFESAFTVSGQTYTRKQDFYALQPISGIAQSASKFATDVRLLASKGEITEQFSSGQVGSSAMPYKRNPIQCERVCSLSRYLICDLQNLAITASSQWLERTLDDSANRRMVIPEMFILADYILTKCLSIVNGLNVDLFICKRHCDEQKYQFATEEILTLAVSRGGNRQELHEKLRRAFSLGFRSPDTYKYLPVVVANDEAFRVTKKEVYDILDNHKFTGMADQQTMNLVAEVRRIIE